MSLPPDMVAPQLTAIVTCRNAGATLERLLENLAWHGAEIVVIDNGSTDATREIAKSHLGQVVIEIISDPYRGYFDLTHQLSLKRRLIQDIGSGWIIHADADEFLDSPDEGPLRDYLGYWGESEIVAFDCDEFMFLPRDESDRHSPENFETTMQAYVPFAERDPKQRVFRATAPLARWMATGGHTVAGPDNPVAPVRLRLRHYFGLSLDRIRADYLSRIFAPRDLAKLWHGSRRGAEMDVVPPDPALFTEVEDGWAIVKAETRLPVFRYRPAKPAAVAKYGPLDLQIVAFSKAAGEKVRDMLAEALPGIRMIVSDVAINDGTPVLQVLEHPTFSAPSSELKTVRHAEDWLRHVAAARQYAIYFGRRYAEFRIEDYNSTRHPVVEAALRLLTGDCLKISRADGLPVHSAEEYAGRLMDITLPLARDLGYG